MPLIKNIEDLIDITGDGKVELSVEVTVSPAGHKVLYVHTNNAERPTLIRICRVAQVSLVDHTKTPFPE